ncbi:uncharacterized protein [Parasteatoda tepidariorum]|uniref:uncharacterized protein n=1 Tax=Parasteatoda tepidariorum TaxID=114398 RepID=UPI001C724E05|nr:uncharacterized protein LOC107447135 [Parasteatoda tepidariorum]
MNKDSDLDLDKLTEIIQELSINSNSDPDASQNLEYKSENNNFVETDNGNCDKESISYKNNLQNFDFHKNIENDLNKNASIEDGESIFSKKVSTQVSLTENNFLSACIENEVEEENQFSKLVTLMDSCSLNDERFVDDFNKKETEDEDHSIKLEPFTDYSLSNEESVYEDVIKKEIDDEDNFIELEFSTDSSSSDDDDDDTLIERGGPEKNKTKKHKETFYKPIIPVHSVAFGRPKLCHPSNSVPILRNNYRTSQQTQTRLSPKFSLSAQQIESGFNPLEILYVNSPDSGFGSPSPPVVSPSTHITSSQYSFPLTPTASPASASHAASLSTHITSSQYTFPLTPTASPASASHAAFLSTHITSSQYTFPLTPAASPASASRAASLSAHITSSQYTFPLTPTASPASASHAGFLSIPTASPSVDVFSPSADISSLPSDIGSPSQPIFPSSSHYISPLTPNGFQSSHAVSLPAPTSFPSVDAVLQSIVSSLPPIASSSPHVDSSSASTLDSVLPFGNESDDKERDICKLVNSFIEAEEYFKERRELQQNSLIPDSNRDDIEQLAEKNYDPIDSEKTNTAKNLQNEKTSLEEVLSHLIISDLSQEPDEVSDEWWKDNLNDLYDSVCNANRSRTTISSSKNSTHIASKVHVQCCRVDRQVTSGEQKISFQIKDNAKMVLRNSESFDVTKYLDEIKNVLLKIKHQEKSKKKIRIIDYDERENYKNLDQTNLHSAVIESNVEKVLCLVETLKRYDQTFFDINCRDANKKTALDYAIQKKIPSLVNYLKENNAVPAVSV